MKKKYIYSILILILISFFTFGIDGANAGAPGGGVNIQFTNPGTYDTVDEVLTAILEHLQAAIIVVCMVFLVISGIMYMAATGDSGKTTSAKNAMFAAVIGLAIGVGAPSFVREIYEILDVSVPTAASGATRLSEIILNTLNFLLSIVGMLAVISMVVGGIMYFTAAGDERSMETGKNIVKHSIMGIAIAVGSLVIVELVAGFFV